MTGKKLLIVESPAKAKTIEKYLDGEYRVVASVGHVRDLPKSNKSAIDIEGGFIPRYVVSPGKEKVIHEIQALANKASEVILATDPDREGEAIAWHIQQAVGLKSPKRVVFHEITKEAVQEAVLNPRSIDQNLRKAQEARRVLDRLVGYDLSGLIWKKVRYGLSAGRVQSPALRIIMEREREIRAFKPEQFFVIRAEVKTKASGAQKAEKMMLTCVEEPKTKPDADHIVENAQKGSWEIIDMEESEVKRSPRAPFITSTLQQTASSRLGYSPSRTMSLAQRLYESGHITYMRTDSTNLSKLAIGESASVIEKKYGKNYLAIRTYASKSKNAQEAHEAIRPSHVSVEIAGANDDEQKLYRLIRARTLASQMADAKLARTKIIANIVAGSGAKTKNSAGETAIPDFTVVGSRVIFDGWLAVDPDARGEDVELPKVKAKDPLDLLDVISEEKWTEPPGRYTEAGLVKELEKRGIGRPSTYASIIKTLEDREYVQKINKALVPTDTGDVVSSFLEDNFASYISDDFTADMEDKLDDIAIGKAEYEKTLKNFYGPFQKDIKSKEKMAKATNLGEADAKHVCPKCGASMIIKLGRGGKFLSCSRYPECDGGLMIDGQEIKGDTPIGNDPTTGLPIFVKVGRYGPYVQLGNAETLEKLLAETTAASVVTAEGAETAAPVKKARKPKAEKIDPATGLAIPKKPARKKKSSIKPRMASIPKGKDLSSVSVEDAMVYLSLPRKLGDNPETGKTITASIGRFGPYIVHDGDFRSLKGDDSPYTITLERALEKLKEVKKVGRGRWAKKKKE